MLVGELATLNGFIYQRMAQFILGAYDQPYNDYGCSAFSCSAFINTGLKVLFHMHKSTDNTICN